MPGKTAQGDSHRIALFALYEKNAVLKYIDTL